MPELKKKYFIQLIITFILIVSITQTRAQAPSWQWAKGVHSSAAEYATDIAFDPSTGNVVMVGIFNSDLSSFFGPAFAGAIGGGYVAKYDPTGALIWAFPIGNNQDDACNGVTIDHSGNIYVTGYLQQVAEFKGTGTSSTMLTSAGGKDIFIAKYNPAGQLIWVNQAGGTTDDEGTAVSVTANGVFITGYYTGQANFGGIGLLVLNNSDQKAYTSACDVNGNFVWATTIGNTGSSALGLDICADNSNVFITGKFVGASVNVYDAGLLSIVSLLFPSAILNNSSASSYDGFTASFTAAGGLYNWTSTIHSNNNDYSNGITQAGANLYITGGTSNSASFTGYASNPVAASANGLDLFVAQLNKSNGNAAWVKSEPGNNDQQGISIAIDTANLITVAGWFDGGINFTGGSSITSSGNEDIFVVTYDLLGNFNWVDQAGDNGTDIASGVTTGNLGEIYTVGQYEKNAVFGSTALTQDSPPNIFIAKIGCPPIVNNLISATQTICTTQTPNALTGTAPLGGNGSFTYLWQQSTDNITWVSATGTNNTQNYTPGSLTSSMYYRRIVTATNGCNNTSASTPVLITVNQLPTTAVVASSQTICAGSATLTGNNPTVGTGIWSVITGTATITNATSYTTSANGLSIGQNAFIWTISNGSVCVSSSDTLKIKVDALPTTAFAGNNQSLCAATSSTLAANNPAIGTGAWSVASGTATITSPLSNSTSVTGLNIGKTIFMWTISNGTCLASTSTVAINVDDVPSVAVAASSQTLCTNASTLSANNPTVGNGTWTVLTGAASITTPTSNVTDVTGLSLGQNSFVWTITNGSCAASKDTMSIQIDAHPTTANAGSDQALCATSTTTLAANNPSVGSGIWTLFTGTSGITSPTINTTSVTNLNTGQNSFIWTISNGVCPSSSDTVNVRVDANPSTAVVAGNQTICASNGVVSANAPAIGTGVWTVLTGTSTVVSPTTNTTSVTNLNLGQNSFIWTISNGVCPSSSDTARIQVDENPSTAVTSNQTICASNAIITANSPTVGTGVWTLLAGTQTIMSPTTNTTSVANLNTGQNGFVWTISNGVCPSSSDTAMVQVDANPSVASVAANQTICASTTTISANNPAIGNGIWSVLTGSSSITSATSSTTSVINLGIGQNSFIWKISNGICPSSSDTINVQVDANPSAAVVASNQTVCASNSIITANNPTIGTGAWTLLFGTQTILSPTTNTTAVTNLTTGQNGFIWTISNGVCPSSSDTTMVQVDAHPSTAVVSSNQTLCASTTTISANNPTVGNGVWSVLTGTSTITTSTLNTTSVNGLNIGQNSFVWTISNGVCPSSGDTLNVQVDANPSTAVAAGNQTLCASSAIISASSPAVGTGSWSILSGTQTIMSPTTNTTSVSNLNAGQNGFVWTVSNGVCPSSKDTIVVQVDANPSTAVVVGNQTVCASSTVISANSPAIGNGLWTVLTGTSSIASPATNTTSVTNLSVGQNAFVWTITNGVCPSSSDTMTVRSDANPSIAIVAANQTLCASTTATISANSPIVGTAAWSVLTGASSVASPTVSTSAVTNLNIGQNSFVWTISNGICPSSSDTINIQVDANPSTAVVVGNQTLCANATTISANNPLVGNGIWSVLTGVSSIASPSTNVTSVTNLNTGLNSFVWTISNGICPSSSDTMYIETYASPTAADAGPDQSLCALTTLSLTAAPLSVGTGVWTVISGASNVAINSSPNTAANNLSIGQNSFVWAVSNGVCPVSKDTVTIHVDAMPTVANAGRDSTVYNSLMSLGANTPLIGTGLWSLVSGSGSFIDNMAPGTEITGLENGQTIVQWAISNGVCPASVDELTITIKSFMIPNGFSPNGDGVNDNFEVKGLDEFTGVKLNVFNRWGSTVYENGDYKNNWNGKNLSGEDLSDDTYFFILEIPNKKTYNGYVVLKRK